MEALGAEELFPTHGPLDEDQQIGRTATIVALTDRLRERGDALLLEDRRVGKTSVVRAALTRVRLRHDGITGEVNLTAANVSDGASFARALMRVLHDADGALSRHLRARGAIADQGARLRRARTGLRRLTSAIGGDELQPLADLLPLLELEAPTLDTILQHLAHAGRRHPVVVFLDEVQELQRWPDAQAVQQSLARFMRTDGRRTAVVVAGSDRTATASIFAEGTPLHWDFEAFPLPPIDEVDWHQGLAERFAAAGVAIESARIRQILDASRGHPLRTMTVAKETLREARAAAEDAVSWGAVDVAIRRAGSHPSWRD